MKEIKLLKRALKKRKRFTLQILVAFLITGSVGYGIDISEDFVNEDVITNNVGYGINGINVITDGVSITNNGTILSNNFGVFNSKNIMNSGIISSIGEEKSGISSFKKIEEKI